MVHFIFKVSKFERVVVKLWRLDIAWRITCKPGLENGLPWLHSGSDNVIGPRGTNIRSISMPITATLITGIDINPNILSTVIGVV